MQEAIQDMKESVGESKYATWRENLESLVWAIALAVLIRFLVISPFKIPSGSMRMTLIEKDRILVSKFIYKFREPKRGEIVVFHNPMDNRPFIKRLIAVGGDHVEIREGKIFVNDQPLEGAEVFVSNHYYNQGAFGAPGQVVEVPARSYYVLGDNSASSHDSRFWGFVPERLMIGHAVCIFWPLNRIRLLR